MTPICMHFSKPQNLFGAKNESFPSEASLKSCRMVVLQTVLNIEKVGRWWQGKKYYLTIEVSFI